MGRRVGGCGGAGVERTADSGGKGGDGGREEREYLLVEGIRGWERKRGSSGNVVGEGKVGRAGRAIASSSLSFQPVSETRLSLRFRKH